MILKGIITRGKRFRQSRYSHKLTSIDFSQTRSYNLSIFSGHFCRELGAQKSTLVVKVLNGKLVSMRSEFNIRCVSLSMLIALINSVIFRRKFSHFVFCSSPRALPFSKRVGCILHLRLFFPKSALWIRFNID